MPTNQANSLLQLALDLQRAKGEAEAKQLLYDHMGRIWPDFSITISGDPDTGKPDQLLVTVSTDNSEYGALCVAGDIESLPPDQRELMAGAARLLAARLDGLKSHELLLRWTMDMEQTMRSMSTDLEDKISQRATIEKHWHQTETRYEILFNQLKEAVYLHPLLSDGTPDKFVQVNRGACEMLGYTEDELLGMSPLKLDDPEYAQTVIPQAAVDLKNKGQTVIQTVHLAKDGSRVPVEINIQKFDLDGVPHVLSVARDLTERKRVERDLAERETRYRELFENMSSGVTVFEPIEPGKDIVIKDINKAGAGMSGVAKEEVVGQKLLDAFPGMRDFEGVKYLRRVARTGQPEHLPQTIYRDNRLILWMDSYIYRLPGGEVVVIYDDLSESMRNEEALRRSEDRLRFIMDSLPVLVVELDSDMRYRFVNQRYETLFGVKPEDCLGFTVSDILGKDFASRITDKVQAALAGNKGYYEYTVPLPDGREIMHFAHYLPRYDDRGRVESVYIWAQDVTEQHQAREALLKAKEQAEAANQAKSEFLANMSHELRTPLNGALGMLQIMETTEMDEEQREYLQVAMNSCRNLTSLLGDILDLSRIEAGKMTMQPEIFDLREVLDNIRAIYEQSAEHKGIDFNMTVAEDAPSRVLGDPIRIRQVLFNLVGNAMKFTSEGRVALSVGVLPITRDGECALLFTIEDTGIGINDDQLPHVCEPFTQGDEVYTKRFQGAGLGLMIVKRLLGIMGGAATIDSEPERGTTVYFSLRLGLPGKALDAAAASVESMSALHGRNWKILLAEDDATNAMAVKFYLDKLGHTVRVVENGRQVLEALRETPADCVLMDVQMPVINGLEAAKAIRRGEAGEAHKNVPIVALTAYAMKNDRERFLAAGMNAYLPKPVSMDVLLATIEKAVSPS